LSNTEKMNEQAIERKIARLARGGKARVLDLFSGCGGISLGFQSAGFAITAAVEFDRFAAQSHGMNFHGGNPAHCRPVDITTTQPAELAASLGLGAVSDAIDVIVGGPPCQAFARVGRPKLREIDEHPHAFIHDPRAMLYKRYLDYVEAFSPMAVLMENVPDILNHGGQNIAEETCEVLAAKGYTCGYTLLNAVHYGVPQMRERMFLIAYRNELGADVRFPAPSHAMELPPGYEGSRKVALKTLALARLSSHSYKPTPPPAAVLQPAVTAKEALADLASIKARELLAAGLLKKAANRFDKPVGYRRIRASHYATRMRTWKGYEAPGEGVRDHVVRFLPRDYEIFARMAEGDQYPQAHAQAMRLFDERLAARRAGGARIAERSKAWKDLLAQTVPPYDVGKFPNKWRKMAAAQPARTLMAHLGKDSYSHIHYDSAQARTISVREAARLQSFPDGFRFSGSMNAAFRQIGNAVPPLMAAALGREIARTLRQGCRDQCGVDEAGTQLLETA
jgi:DNA (cytosine-5)-methyltransferase 1